MVDREKLMKGLAHCKDNYEVCCVTDGCPYFHTEDCTSELSNDAAAVIEEQAEEIETLKAEVRALSEKNAMMESAMEEQAANRTAEYIRWAEESKAQVCATCANRSEPGKDRTDCPIEWRYVVPEDGHCHLWRGRTGATNG